MSNTAIKECGSCKGRTELVICWKCAKKLRRLLVGQDDDPGLDWYADRLAEQAYGQAKMGSAQRQASGGPRPAPLNGRASDLLREVLTRTSTWAAEVLGVSGRTAFSPAAYCQALAGNVSALMGYDGAATMIADTKRFISEARKAINRPPDMYCGPCPNVLESGQKCGTDLRVDEGERFIQCPRCRTLHDVEVIRERLMDHVDDEPKSRADLYRLFRWLGWDIKQKTFYNRMVGVTPRMYLHKDGSRNMRWFKGSVALYAYSDAEAAMSVEEAAS